MIKKTFSRLNRFSGFLLIEVLVTVIVLGTVIVFIVQALSSSLFAARRASLYTQALMLIDEFDLNVKLETHSAPYLKTEDFPKSFEFSKGEADFRLRQELFATDLPNLSEMISTISWSDSKAKGEFSVSRFVPSVSLGEE